MICTCDNLVQDELQKEKDRNTELVADSKQLSSLKKVCSILYMIYMHTHVLIAALVCLCSHVSYLYCKLFKVEKFGGFHGLIGNCEIFQ